MSSEYASIATKARLESVKLVHSSFDLAPAQSEEETLRLQIATRWIDESYEQELGRIGGICEWAFLGVREQETEPRMRIVARYGVQYSRVGEEPDVASAFLRDVGRMAVYPYFRAHVAVLASEAAMMLPPLPSINIGTFQKQNVLAGRVGTRIAEPEDKTG